MELPPEVAAAAVDAQMAYCKARDWQVEIKEFGKHGDGRCRLYGAIELSAPDWDDDDDQDRHSPAPRYYIKRVQADFDIGSANATEALAVAIDCMQEAERCLAEWRAPRR